MGVLLGLGALGAVAFLLFRLRARRRSAYMGGGITFETYEPPLKPDAPRPASARSGALPPVLPPIAREPMMAHVGDAATRVSAMSSYSGTASVASYDGGLLGPGGARGRGELFPSMLSTSSDGTSAMVLSPAVSEAPSAARPHMRDTVVSRATAASVIGGVPGHSSFSADASLDPFVDPVPVGAEQDPFRDPEADQQRASAALPSPLPLPEMTRLSVVSADVQVSL